MITIEQNKALNVIITRDGFERVIQHLSPAKGDDAIKFVDNNNKTVENCAISEISSITDQYGNSIDPLGDIDDAWDFLTDNISFFSIPQNQDFESRVALGKVEGSSAVNKFGYNLDIDGASEIIASFGGAFDPLTDIMLTAQTFNVTYDNSLDGSSTTGARTLLVTYLDENFMSQEGFHVLGSSGSDVTSFTGVGINRAVVVSFGGDAFNGGDIDLIASTDLTTQARIPAEESVTQQCIFHTQVGHSFLWQGYEFNATKLTGGGVPEITVTGYSFSRVTLGRYEIFRKDFDTQRGNSIESQFKNPFPIGGREVVYFEGATDTVNSIVNFRFSGIEEKVS